jgi:uncharacterized DUF497 family protein
VKRKENVLTTYIQGGKILLGDVVHRRNDVHFVWDRWKAENNVRKHGITFETACEAFFDPLIHLLRSEVLGGEERETAIGMTEGWRLLVVAYTLREEAIRLISARTATPGERRHYEET